MSTSVAIDSAMISAVSAQNSIAMAQASLVQDTACLEFVQNYRHDPSNVGATHEYVACATYALNGADFYETRGTEMYRLIAIVGCLALFVLALFYGKDPSMFAAALLVIVAMPEGSAISIQIERKDETDKSS